MTGSNIAIMVTMALYLAMMIGIGIYFSRRNKSSDDFYLGGRKLGTLVTAMSAEASDMSSWLLMGLPGVALLSGTAEAGWTAIGLALGTWLNWLIVSNRIRIYSDKINAVTIPDFFSKRFHDNQNILTCISAIVIIVFFIPYTASGFNACGSLFAGLFGVNYQTAMIISALVITIYTALGGFLAASTTDFIQSIVMTIALIVVLAFGINAAGGWSNVVANAKALPGYLSMTQSYNPATGGTTPYNALTIASTMAWGLGYFGMPHILLRFMAIKDVKKLKTSRRVASIWVVIAMGVAVLIGIIGYAMTQNGTLETMTVSTESQRIIVRIADLISKHGILPAIVAGIILSGILAATMSTADSQLLAAASSVSQNLIQDTLKIKVSKKTSVIMARAAVIVIAIIGMIWARNEGSVFSIVSFAWGGFGAAFGPVMLCALFWKRTNKWGALAGMVVGGAMVFIWKYAIAPLGGILAIYELLPAFICGLIAVIVVSLLTKAPEKAIVDEFEAVQKEI
jgi:sodium/proline symporter